METSVHTGHLNGAVPVYDLARFMDNESDEVALVVIRTVTCTEASVMLSRAGGGVRWREHIYAKSSTLKKALDSVASCYFQRVEKETPIGTWLREEESSHPGYEKYMLTPDSLFLFHHRHALTDYAANNQWSKKHVDALLLYTEETYSSEFAEAEELFHQGRVNQRHIMKLFKPNALVTSGTHNKPAAFVLQEWPEADQDEWITLKCWSLQTDGNAFVRKLSHLSIPPLKTEIVDIQKLVAYPLHFASANLIELLESRGRKLWDLWLSQQVTYRGWNVAKDQYFVSFRFMIDHKIYHKMHDKSMAFHFQRPSRTHVYDRMPPYVDITQDPPDVAFLLMPPDLHGFYLTEKKWIKLFVDDIHPVKWNKSAHDRLVLPPQTKDLVKALVTVRTSQRGVKQGLGIAGKRTDLISGKDNGLIMLLHGGPGTGKTLTAESVAEIAEMPLYRVTCGDIGTSAEAVEKYLNTVFHLAKTWNCVLLLDDADVFLEE